MAAEEVRHNGREGVATLVAVMFVALASAILLTALSLLLARLGSLCSYHPFMIWLLPLGGLLTYSLYHALRVPFYLTDAEVIYQVSCTNDPLAKRSLVPARLMIAILMGTTLTIAFGGSVGGESAAFQVGSAIALCGVIPWLYRHIAPACKSAINTTLLARCGMTSALAALFATPFTSALFITEMSSWLTDKHDLKAKVKTFGVMYISALLGTFVAKFAKGELLSWELHPLGLAAAGSVHAGMLLLKLAALFGLTFAGALLWYYALEFGRKAGKRLGRATAKAQEASRSRVVLVILGAGLLCTLLIFALQPFVGFSELGTGSALMTSVVNGQLLGDGWHTVAISLAKLLITVLLLAGLFKGGDLTPTMAIGAALGGGCAALLGLPVPLGALAGLSVFLPVCTNCVLAAMALGLETFGVPGLVASAPFALVAYALTRKISFYHNSLSADPR